MADVSLAGASTWGAWTSSAAPFAVKPLVGASTWGDWDSAVTLGSRTLHLAGVSKWSNPQSQFGTFSAATMSPRPTIVLYDAAGLTKIQDLTTAEGIKFTDAVTDPGNITFSLPVGDDAEMQEGRIVKVWWKGFPRVAARLKSWSTEWVKDDTTYHDYNLPGALSMWNDAIIYPEFGLNRRTTGSTRLFGPMSNYVGEDFSWFVAADWPHVTATPWSTTPGVLNKQPAGLSGPNPCWITAGDSAITWFRRGFNTYADMTYKMYVSGAGYLTLYLDGEEIVTPSQQNGQYFHTLVTVSGVLQAGGHSLAAKVAKSTEPDPPPPSLIFTLIKTDASGNPVKGAPVLNSDGSWIATTTNPGWHGATVIRSWHSEAVAREVRAAEFLGISWNWANDSAGVDFTDHGIWSFPVASLGCADGAVQQAQSAAFDLHVNALHMTVGAFNRLGRDKTSTCTLRLPRNGGNLLDFTETVNRQRFNTGLLQLADGTWLQSQDDASVDYYGPVETGVSLGTTPDDDTAAEAFNLALSTAKNPTSSWTISLDTTDSSLAQPYIDFTVGDSILVPNPQYGSDATTKARVMSISPDASAEIITCTVQVVVDPT